MPTPRNYIEYEHYTVNMNVQRVSQTMGQYVTYLKFMDLNNIGTAQVKFRNYHRSTMKWFLDLMYAGQSDKILRYHKT